MTVRPLVYSDRKAALAAVGVSLWLLSVELGTSRAATAAAASRSHEQVVDASSSRRFDLSAGVALTGGLAAPLALPGGTIAARRTAFATGLVTLAGCGVLSRRARHHLGRFHRHHLTVHPDHVLVDTGPYRVVRHPLYAATIGVFVGLGLVLGHWASVALAALPAAALLRRLGTEEPMLVDALGDQYVAYQARTARLLPGIW
ncbi:MAG: isoprenylcysteine carboxylmethyltransferase family protein [Actinomycetota bacterium]